MSFSIKAKTYTLKLNPEDCDEIILDKNNKYVIPVYQRPYSWKEEQVKKFISDIFVSYWGHDTMGSPDNMFIGTMQLSKSNSTRIQEVIDGQQRLSTFLILFKVLQSKFEISLLKEYKLDWLSTEVNGGRQQLLLEEFVNSHALQTGNDLNRYSINANILSREIDRIISLGEGNGAIFDINQFIQHLFSRIYFVVLETEASLSKTLKIFDTINTAGLPLHEADVFKIRMFEYLTENRGFSKDIFDEISALYERVDAINAQERDEIVNFNEVLRVYQFYLISKFELPVELYTYATKTFYDHLFESIFMINQWRNFSKAKEVLLELDELKEFIDIIYHWKKGFKTEGFKDVEHTGLIHLWDWSRYSRFRLLIYMVLFREKDHPKKEERLAEIVNKLVRLYLIYSVYYYRHVNEITNLFNNPLMKILVNGSYEKLVEWIDTKYNGLSKEFKEKFKRHISGDITENRRVKVILCRLSALLEENTSATSKHSILQMRSKLFNYDNPLDIEHIQSYNDENKEERSDIIETWGSEINSIGNLVVLESSINRSIGNRESQKLENYRTSELVIVNKRLVKDYSAGWDLKSSQVRKRKEVNKLFGYLFNQT